MNEEKHCLICKVTDDKLPLLNFSYQSKTYHICSAHIPVLIHKADQLEHLLPGLDAESME